MRTIRHRGGIYHACDQCGGCAVTVPQIRQMAGDRWATQVLRLLNQQSFRGGPRCPFCNQFMRRFHVQNPSLELDGCRSCRLIWFDPGEFEVVPKNVVVSEAAQELALRERLALHELEKVKREMEANPEPEGWHWLPMLLGFPAELSDREPAGFPWATYGLALLITAVSLIGWWGGEGVLAEWGLIPNQWWRMGGLTFLTSFFLHANAWHWFANFYFLCVFGDNVEDYLGRKRWLALLICSALAGDILHILLDPRPDEPCVGASGGISGLITFYALQFPHVRLGLLVYWRLVRIPAGVAWFIWILFQFILAFSQLGGHGEVSALAHLGGAVVGAVAWWIHKRRTRDEPATDM
ncbi:rhomboid family intramembrane serine protease [Limisphaera ngatamarikiensis]|uniref:Rhomboid family intramembrane serine protease n=1 Tax=Limisphaera ngatamarikiensis TaxID=1324935 RepID=A0A6M1RXT7_9BACT|nr:rhomboid family intramembrane serine protease [Limisphaera ngatamarikiensis]NGO40154.1 rhomboid family intramembrane serine protease [Limisphaera ngatamarikiensis]